MLENLTVGRKRNGAAATQSNTGKDLCPLNGWMSESAEEKSWTGKEYLSVKGALWVQKKWKTRFYNVYPQCTFDSGSTQHIEGVTGF